MTDKINKEMLIELVRNEPALWNKREKNYNNRELKPDLWEKIGQSLNMTGKAAQKSWETLRDSYRKIRRRIESERPIQGVKKDISWPHYNSMCFLDGFLTAPDMYAVPAVYCSPKRETFVEELNPKDVPQDMIGDEEEDEEDYYPKECDVKLSIEPVEKKSHIRSRSKRPCTFEEEALELEKRKVQILESRQYMSGQKTIFTDADDDYLFLMSLMPYLKKLDDVQKMRLRMEILRSVTEELEKSKYQEVSASSWNQSGTFTLKHRASPSESSESSRGGTPTPSGDGTSAGLVATAKSKHFMTPSGT